MGCYILNTRRSVREAQKEAEAYIFSLIEQGDFKLSEIGEIYICKEVTSSHSVSLREFDFKIPSFIEGKSTRFYLHWELKSHPKFSLKQAEQEIIF